MRKNPDKRLPRPYSSFPTPGPRSEVASGTLLVGGYWILAKNQKLKTNNRSGATPEPRTQKRWNPSPGSEGIWG